MRKESIYIDASKIQRRGGNCNTKRDLDTKVKLLEKEGWKIIRIGQYKKGENPFFKYFYEAIFEAK